MACFASAGLPAFAKSAHWICGAIDDRHALFVRAAAVATAASIAGRASLADATC